MTFLESGIDRGITHRAGTLDAVLEPTKQAVLDMKASMDAARIVHQDQALRQAAGQAFYNTSKFTLRDLRSRASQQQLRSDFESYLDGFSPNVQDILEKFEFRNQIPRLSKADALHTLIEKLLSPDTNLSPKPVLNGDGSSPLPTRSIPALLLQTTAASLARGDPGRHPCPGARDRGAAGGDRGQRQLRRG